MALPWYELGIDPLIYVAPSSELVCACMAAFGGLPFRVVTAPGEWRDAPPNFLATAVFPLDELLDRTTLAITGGSAVLVAACARAGVPQLVYAPDPLCERSAAMVEEAGAGVRLQRSDLSAERLRQIAGRVMAEPRYTRAAMAWRERQIAHKSEFRGIAQTDS